MNDICKIADAVYAMGKTIKERLGLKRRKKKQKEDDVNKRARKLESELKLAR